MSGFWYLAGPYSKLDHDKANRLHCETAALLMEAGVTVFSPIAMGHAISTHGGLGWRDSDWWLAHCKPLVDAAVGCIVLTIDGWAESHGTWTGARWFEEQGKPVIPMHPGEIPVLPKTEVAPKLAYLRGSPDHAAELVTVTEEGGVFVRPLDRRRLADLAAQATALLSSACR